MKRRFTLLIAMVMLLTAMATNVFASSAYAQSKDDIDYVTILENLGANFERSEFYADTNDVNTLSNIKESNIDFDNTSNVDIPSDVKGDIIKFNNTSYAVVEDNLINYIDRLSENANDSLESIQNNKKINFTSTMETLDYVKNNLIKNEKYELTNEYDVDDSTVLFKFNYVDNNVEDTFNYINVIIDKKNNELILFHRSGDISDIGLKDNFIDYNNAKSIAIKVFEKIGIESDLNFDRIKTVKTNAMFEKYTGINVDVGQIKVAYVFKNSIGEIYIDAKTGECIGGDIYKELGGIIGAPELTYTIESINAAKKGLSKLGYTPIKSKNSQNFRTEVPNILKSGVKAFYSCSHGSTDVISSKKDKDNKDRQFHRNNVPSGNYKFIYLDACNTGKNSDWANAFGIYDGTTSNKAFLGWYESVGQKLSYDFSVQLWKKLDKNISVRNAALKAADAVPEYCPIRFRGNRNYNGYK